MRAWIAFTKKEWLEQLRSGKLLILTILFFAFGIMNPAIAKLTPWLLETLSASMEESGMTVTAVTVDAFTSWTQFFKNIPMALIVFVIAECGCFTKEYQSGSLILSLTKGLRRDQVVLSKAAVLSLLWTAGYWLCFGVTYLYTEYYWDQSVLQNLASTVLGWWLLGLWTVMLTVLFSVICRSNTGVLLGSGGVFLASYLLGLLPALEKSVPTALMNGMPILMGGLAPSELWRSMAVTGILTVASLVAAIPIFNRRQI